VLDDGPATDVLGGSPYVLEVTSPGVDRPLTEPRHWRRALGRLVKVAVDGEEVVGRVVGARDDEVELDVGGARRTCPVSSLGRGRVQVEFNRAGAAGPAADEEA
jgi:ribosome maturation factor RimP